MRSRAELCSNCVYYSGKIKRKKNCICESWPLVYGRYTCLTKLFCLALEQREMRHQKIKENRRWLKASSKGQGHLEMPAPIGSRSAAPSCEFATLSVFVRWLIGYLALLIFLFFLLKLRPMFSFIIHWPLVLPIRHFSFTHLTQPKQFVVSAF